MGKKRKILVLTGLLFFSWTFFLLLNMEAGVQETAAKEQPSPDYDEAAQDMKVDRESRYYPAYADYLCYMKQKYPKQAKLTDIITDQPGYSNIRVWKGDGYTMKAYWSADSKEERCRFKWFWEDEEIQNAVTRLLEERKTGHSSASDRIVSGNLYEITENEFHPGIDYDLNEDETARIMELLQGISGKNEAGASEKMIRFILELYDEDQRLQLSLGIGPDGEIYSEQGNLIEDEELQKLVETLISKAES
ncbi:hypothetical protein GPL15_04525 [Clostridium sp. MCC353]|uniref:hypothetical protein n=1 Tax=Clostridium sp. MCC353 TaxID=2592646 RepID=UPI001C03116E|nr:hypothetical protein [Clostridium sp. MCC353]MBT9775777.1 hypothetical protein [Clostridium sp. MCC353]